MIENTQQQNKLAGKDAELELRLKTYFVDLASERVGGETLSCSDDFFAEMENLLKSGRGIFIDDKYTQRGKWMDGWSLAAVMVETMVVNLIGVLFAWVSVA